MYAIRSYYVGKGAFLAAVTEKGEYIRSKVAGWKLPGVASIRGRGLMIGLDTVKPASELQLACLERGLCVSTAGPNILRFLPPLNINTDEIDRGLDILYTVLRS